ncbi:MAG: NAD(P)/FAD-dependent oxidoreductase [Phycisphaerales bacterium]|nr:NAD(P)/FAD-dependent oxidoreductase [Phycisphaerales bacterium]
MTKTQNTKSVQVAIIGAGASGLMTAIAIARAIEDAGQDPKLTTIILLDGSHKIGIKILVAGGGRCNVTHHAVDEHQYATTKPAIVRTAFKRFSANDAIRFFKKIGVDLKQEPTGKMFPITDDAHTVLHALLDEADRLGISIVNPWRVDRIEHSEVGYAIYSKKDHQPIFASRVVLAVGGKALPKSGSDGHGYEIAKSLGHTITKDIFPALVPLIAADNSRWITKLSGIACPATLSVVTSTEKRIKSFTNDTLITHFGLSGPAPMDISRYLSAAKLTDRKSHLEINWLPDQSFEQADEHLTDLGKSQIRTHLRTLIPERLAMALCEQAGIDPAIPGHALSRDARRTLAHLLTATKVYIQADRGFTHAEVTAGGIPLDEINRKDFQSRQSKGLYLVGEILDVDGRIGGFNFQWAWSTGYIAGNAIARSILDDNPSG